MANNEQKGTQCPAQIRKTFEIFGLLLAPGASKEERRFREFICLDKHGFYGMYEDLLFYDNGKIDFIRVENKKRFPSDMEACDHFGIDPQTLLCLN